MLPGHVVKYTQIPDSSSSPHLGATPHPPPPGSLQGARTESTPGRLSPCPPLPLTHRPTFPLRGFSPSPYLGDTPGSPCASVHPAAHISARCSQARPIPTPTQRPQSDAAGIHGSSAIPGLCPHLSTLGLAAIYAPRSRAVPNLSCPPR